MFLSAFYFTFLFLVLVFEFRKQERDHVFVNPLLMLQFPQDVDKMLQRVVVLILTVVFVFLVFSCQQGQNVWVVENVGVALVTDLADISVLPELWFCKERSL